VLGFGFNPSRDIIECLSQIVVHRHESLFIDIGIKIINPSAIMKLAFGA